MCVYVFNSDHFYHMCRFVFPPPREDAAITTKSPLIALLQPQAPPSCSPFSADLIISMLLSLQECYINPGWRGSVDWVLACEATGCWFDSQSPIRGTCLGCRPGPHWGARKRQPHIDVSLPLSLSLPLWKQINFLKKECYINGMIHCVIFWGWLFFQWV